MQFLVSNVEMPNSEIFAPEINFYIKNSTAPAEQLQKDIQSLYEIRATALDLGQQTELIVEIGRRVLIISAWGQTEFMDQLEQHGFSVVVVLSSQVDRIARHETGLRVTVKDEGDVMVLEADHVLWGNCPPEYAGRQFIYDHEQLGHENTLAAILAASGVVHFKNFVRHDPSLCLLHNKRESVCGQCVDICPTGAITRKINPRKIDISHIDCIGCGACVAVCPTGAMDSTRMTRSTFARIRSFFAGRTALIVPAGISFGDLQVELAPTILPLVIEDDLFLDEWHLLSLLQTSGCPVIYFNEKKAPVIENVVRVINDIFQKRYQRDAVLLCDNAAALQTALQDSAVSVPFADLVYDPDERGVNKKTAMSRRLAFFTGKSDLGTVQTGPYLHYGVLRLDPDKCTLCLSCAEGCTPGALSVHPEDNTLRFTPSLCTCCGYCVATCPEQDCLAILRDQLVLHPEFFRKRVLAQDELFKCVECGRGFAPAKSIARIAAVMKPKFGGDSTKIKTLYCCPDCKAKVMLETLQSESI